MLLSFFIVWLCINLVCSIPDAALKFPRENAGKVSQRLCYTTNNWKSERKKSLSAGKNTVDRLFSHIFHCNPPQNPLQFVEEEQHGEHRAAYGKYLLQNLSEYLTPRFGKGFSVTNLKQMWHFYLTYANNQIGQIASDQFKTLPGTRYRLCVHGPPSPLHV